MAKRTGDMGKREAEVILGLTGSYDARKLRQAYARQAMRWHPDRQGKGVSRERAERRMIEINLAYDRLKGLFTGGTTTVITEGTKWARTAAGVGSHRPPSQSTATGQRGTSTWYSAAGASSPGTHAGADRAGPGPSATAGERTGHGAATPPPPPPPPPKPIDFHRRVKGSTPPPPRPGGPNFAHRIVSKFPWRIAFLVVILMLFVSPEHAGMDYIANFGRLHFVMLYQGGFLDFLLWQVVLVPLAIYNLFTGTITDALLREPLLWLTERGRRPRP